MDPSGVVIKSAYDDGKIAWNYHEKLMQLYVYVYRSQEDRNANEQRWGREGGSGTSFFNRLLQKQDKTWNWAEVARGLRRADFSSHTLDTRWPKRNPEIVISMNLQNLKE